MANRRGGDRLKKRMALQFGTGDLLNRKAFTEDLSPMGLFIRTANISNPNTVIRVEMIQDDVTIRFDARVMWAKRVPQNLFHLVKKSGMGVRIIRFDRGKEDYLELCTDPRKPIPR